MNDKKVLENYLEVKDLLFPLMEKLESIIDPQERNDNIEYCINQLSTIAFNEEKLK